MGGCAGSTSSYPCRRYSASSRRWGGRRALELQGFAHYLGGGHVQQRWGQWDWPLTLSAPERAILELLDEVPQRETFHQADMLMEGLRTLSPKRLQKLLVSAAASR